MSAYYQPKCLTFKHAYDQVNAANLNSQNPPKIPVNLC